MGFDGFVVQSYWVAFLSLLVEYLIISALTPLVSAAFPLSSWLMASLSSCIVNGFIVSWCCSYLSSCSCSCFFVVIVQRSSKNSANNLSDVFVFAIFVLHVRFQDFLRLVLIEVVFWNPRKVVMKSEPHRILGNGDFGGMEAWRTLTKTFSPSKTHERFATANKLEDLSGFHR